MSDEEKDDFPSPNFSSSSANPYHTDPTPSNRTRVSFTSLTHSLSETVSRRNFSAPSGSSSRDVHHARSDPQSNARHSFFHRSRRSHEDRRSRFHNRRNSPRTSAGVLARSILGRTSSGTPSTSTRRSSDYETASAAASVRKAENRRVNYRRYSVGEICLVECQHSRLAQLVNRYGFPPGAGFTPEEQRGPYTYVLASVKKRHFEEDAEYYTVTRFDTAVDQRADAEWMIPIKRGSKGEAAAREAATEHRRDGTSNGRQKRRGSTIRSSELNDSKVVQGVEVCLSFLLTPFLWLYEISLFVLKLTKLHAKHFLYGESPYKLSVRITAVNVVVFCNTWVMFIDQLRLAFFPPKADFGLAIVSCIFWFILVLELLFELFIRPDNYTQIIVSEKAYDPSTVRYINVFHLIVECVALFAFIPEFACLFTDNFTCGDRPSFSFFNAARISVLGPDRLETFYGRAFFALVRLRVFGLVRHWKKMWTTKTFVNMKSEETGVFMPARISLKRDHRQKEKTDRATRETDDQKLKDAALVNASHIGTALMVVNSHRAMTVFWFIFGLFPLLFCFEQRGAANATSSRMVELLQQNNLEFSTVGNNESCLQWGRTVTSWAIGVTTGNTPQIHSDSNIYLLYLEITPTGRCASVWPGQTYGVVTQNVCRGFKNVLEHGGGRIDEICAIWGTNESTSDESLAERAGIRTGAITTEEIAEFGDLTYPNGTVERVEYRIEAKFNNTFSVEPAAFGSFLLQLSLLLYILGFLSILRRDARVLVLGPLRRMLKIVAQYAKNPLATIKGASKHSNDDTDTEEESSSSDDDDISQDNDLGSFETEQLINAVSKITDLLRKCWGVAGAGIISTNLSREEASLTEVFNPTVPGTSVYAIFGFCAVNAFDHYLRALGGDVMILINDVASVLHNEVFRWGLGDSGQCNKNLGSAWLMVFRIGDVETVIRKLDEATNVVFSNTQKTRSRNRNRRGNAKKKAKRRSGSRERTTRSKSANAMSLSLAQLPGISVFTDRALIGILKTFAGIYRDAKLLSWKKDFRLGAGVGAFSVNMIFGLDAGWAMEGAVGSEYKIDATYLSPHVNMASRMMSACKQYGVSILLSQAVQELLSDVARSKLRHLDTVTVKGSSLRQRIYTYDARHKGVDFFLFGKTDEQADMDSDLYNTNIWDTDQDLTSMRQHVTDDFLEEFDKGRKEYLAGHWPSAIKHLETANEILLQNMVEEGYIEYELNELQNHVLDEEDARLAEQEFRNETEDGPSRRLLAYMRSQGGVAPATWEGYRPLTSK